MVQHCFVETIIFISGFCFARSQYTHYESMANITAYDAPILKNSSEGADGLEERTFYYN